MNFSQLKYIVALAETRHFVDAAKKCNVTQPTLSMQIKKLEEELGVELFERHKQPVRLTQHGERIVETARSILREEAYLKSFASGLSEKLEGQFNVGVIPTIAPYLLPLFLSEFLENYPQIQLKVEELVTSQIIEKLKSGALDIGILVTPVMDNQLSEYALFKESFVGFVSPEHPLYKHRNLQADDLKQKGLWILNQGHCFRNQVVRICDYKVDNQQLNYESGSLETIRKMVLKQQGFTLLPELATYDLHEDELDHLRYFTSPEPAREVSLVTNKIFLSNRVLDALKQSITASLPKNILKSNEKQVVPVF